MHATHAAVATPPTHTALTLDPVTADARPSIASASTNCTPLNKELQDFSGKFS